MNLSALRVSLALWKRRKTFRDRYLARARKRGQQAGITKWTRLVREADEMIGRRNRQIVSINKANKKKAAATSGVTRYDGVPVAAWLVPYLDYARQHGWKGKLVSGWRDPHYSQSLCYKMCGAPSCPGRCAGLSSNHVGDVKPRGAVDVSDYLTFGRIMRNCPLEPKIFNSLGDRDPVHFSASGN